MPLRVVTICLTVLPVVLGSGLVDPAIVGDGGFLQSLDGEAWSVSGGDGLTNFGGVVPGERRRGAGRERHAINFPALPGDLLTDMQRAGVVGDPLYEVNFEAYTPQGRPRTPVYDRTNYTYSSTFISDPPIAAAREVLLVLDGVKMASAGIASDCEL